MIDTMKIEKNLKIIKKTSIEKEKENWEFRAFLKGYDIEIPELDKIVKDLYTKLSSKIDCTKCANCCKEVQPCLDNRDIDRFVTKLKISKIDFKDRYLIEDSEEPPT